MYSTNGACEFWCISLDGALHDPDSCVQTEEPGCHCKHGYYRNENGHCVPMEDCGCITEPNGEVKEVNHNFDQHFRVLCDY